MKFEITGKYLKLYHTVTMVINAKTPYVAYTMSLKIFKDIFKTVGCYPDNHEIEITVTQLDGVPFNEKGDTTTGF